MKRTIVFGSIAFLIGLIAALLWLRANRFERLANSDLTKFANSERNELYAFYPHLIDKIADTPELAARVALVHLTISDFESTEFDGRDFSSLARLPNLKTIECTYSHNLDTFVPTLNLIETLCVLDLYYCDPITQTLEHLDSDSLQSITIHSYNALTIPHDVIDAFAQRMPDCTISFTTD